MQRRLFLSASIMFLVFGLIMAVPPIYMSFKGTRMAYTMHVEAVQNALMLIAVALMVPFLNLSHHLLTVLEISINLGAWFNVIPWVYGAYTGCVLRLGAMLGSESKPFVTDAPKGTPEPPNNAEYASNIVMMLNICMIGDVIGWALVILGLLAAGGKAKKE